MRPSNILVKALTACVWLSACILLGSCGRPAIRSTVVFEEGSDSCHFYRIPAMTLDAQGNMVAAIDRRYENLADLGYRKTSIDISCKRSTDGGRTWSPQEFIARGDTNRVLGFGYGDASLTTLPSGRILCMFACGNGPKGFRRGLKHTTVCTSDDGGITWSEPRLVPFPDTLHSAFVTSGKGIVDADGDILFSASVLRHDYPDPRPVPWPIEAHLFYSKDGGDSWTLDGAEAGSGLVFSKTFTLEEIGVHTLVYEAVNTDGMGVTKTWTITVSDLPLEVTFSPETTELEAMVGDNLTFSATIVHGSTGAAYAWKAGETTLGTEASLKYACAAEGTVTLTGTVTNAVGESAEKTWTITIGPKVDTGAYMLLDAETMTELPAATVLWFNDKAGSLADNPVPTSTVNSGTKVFKNDMASATWATSGLVKIYTNEIVESSVRYKYKTVRIKVYLGNNDYLPFMVLPINGDKASRPTKVNGTDFYPNHSQDLWNSLVKHDDWNVLEYNIETGNFQNVAATLADVSQIQFRFFVNYSNSNYPNPLSETNTHIVYFDDVEMLE